MEQIKEDYVSFETAKLLKDKEFDEPSSGLYNIEGLQIDAQNYVLPFKNSDDTVNALIAAPTQALVLKWLRINHNIFIFIDRNPQRENVHNYFFVLKTGDGFSNEPFFSGDFDTPEEATEAAIQYTLKNLI